MATTLLSTRMGSGSSSRRSPFYRSPWRPPGACPWLLPRRDATPARAGPPLGDPASPPCSARSAAETTVAWLSLSAGPEDERDQLGVAQGGEAREPRPLTGPRCRCNGAHDRVPIHEGCQRAHPRKSRVSWEAWGVPRPLGRPYLQMPALSCLRTVQGCLHVWPDGQAPVFIGSHSCWQMRLPGEPRQERFAAQWLASQLSPDVHRANLDAALDARAGVDDGARLGRPARGTEELAVLHGQADRDLHARVGGLRLNVAEQARRARVELGEDSAEGGVAAVVAAAPGRAHALEAGGAVRPGGAGVAVLSLARELADGVGRAGLDVARMSGWACTPRRPRALPRPRRGSRTSWQGPARQGRAGSSWRRRRATRPPPLPSSPVVGEPAIVLRPATVSVDLRARTRYRRWPTTSTRPARQARPRRRARRGEGRGWS